MTPRKRKTSADAVASAPLQVHRCRFVDWMPAAIHVLCFNAAGDQLAVARANGDVELWSVDLKWHLKFVIAGSKSSEVTALCWEPESDRLFASSLDGTLWEVDFHLLCKKNLTDSNGGPIWSMVMDADSKQLAVGCEDGRIRLFSYSDSHQIYFCKSFLTTEGRVVSLTWHPKAQKIFSGSETGIIYCWNAVTGRSESRITLEHLGKQKTVVWSLVVLDDLTLVSGDSSGNLSFWNAPTGTLLQKFSHLTADILAICVSNDNNLLYASGVDNQVVEFRRAVAESGISSWSYSYSHRGHSHDVRALALSSAPRSILVSGGIDTQLVWYLCVKFSSIRPTKIASMPYPHSISLATEKRVLLVQKATSLDLWQLAVESAASGLTAQKHKLLLRLNVSDVLNLSCSAMASSAKFVACSNSKEMKLFELDAGHGFQPKKITTLPCLATEPARVLAFSPDSTRLVIASSSHQIRVLDLTKMQILKTFQATTSINSAGDESSDVSSALVSLTISSDGQWLATGDASNNISVYNLDSMQFYCQLPRPSEIHTNMGFNPSGKILVVTLVSNSFVCYDVETKGLSEWYRENYKQFPKGLVDGRNIKGMTFDPANLDFLYLYSQASLYQINMGKHLNSSAKMPSRKCRRRAMSVTDSDGKSDAAEGELVDFEDGFCRVVNRYRPLSFVDFVAENEMIIVETPWLKVLSRLPGALHRHKYGK
uniref:U3 small nucleolar RNA-associated protein 4 n=1 Tax=Peronospora matthiolae TaxID=2874970 RepID=A0AAV1UZD9_9STRA